MPGRSRDGVLAAGGNPLASLPALPPPGGAAGGADCAGNQRRDGVLAAGEKPPRHRPHKLHIIRFLAGSKAHSFRCLSSPASTPPPRRFAARSPSPCRGGSAGGAGLKRRLRRRQVLQSIQVCAMVDCSSCVVIFIASQSALHFLTPPCGRRLRAPQVPEPPLQGEVPRSGSRGTIGASRWWWG